MRLCDRLRRVVIPCMLGLMILAVICAPSLAADPPANFPPPMEWDQPSGAPTAPGDAYTVSFGSATPVASAPVISEWNRIAMPNETFTLTGTRFTRRTGAQAGSDITVWLWAWNGTSGTLRQCKIWKVYGDYLVMACVPSDVPFGQYLVWVENQDGVSSPVCINKTQAEWLGPRGPYAAPGDTKRVFGKNLSSNHGTTSSYVYIQPSAGGSFVACPVTNVEPCAVAFTVPAGTPNGSYKVYAHSGHGGQYGWSSPLDLTVQSAWVRGTGVYNLSPSGGDDTTALQNAINTVSGWSNGGTVQLASGSYSVRSTVTMNNNVRLAGAGKSQTTVVFTGCNLEFSKLGANNLAVESMKILPASGTAFSILSRSVSGGSYNNDVLVRNVDFVCNTDTGSSISTYFMVDRLEVDSCTWQGPLTGDGRDWYIHNNTLNGGRGAPDGSMALLQGNQTPHGRYVIEYNAASTPAWPNKSGDRNYYDWMTTAQWSQLIWCSRLIYYQMGTDSYECSYISHNTTQDVAIDDNKGETILFHSSEAHKYAQVASNSGRTLSIRTDGTIDGASGFAVDAGSWAPMTSVPNAIVWGNSTIDNMAYVQICYGTGIGQIRKIVSHTSSTITVDSDWRVPPASDSRIQINYINRNHIVYQNTMNAMPVGFVNQHHCASMGVNFDGGSFGCVAEGNKSYRTFYGDTLQGYVCAPSFFNEIRSDENYSELSSGSSLCARTQFQWYQSYGGVVGPYVIGNYIRGAKESKGMSSSSVSDILTSNSRHLIGCAVEATTASNGGLSSGNLDDTLWRNNSFTYNGTKVTMQSGSLVNLLGNTYSGTGTKYSGSVSFKDKPTPEYRVARFTGTVGQAVANVTIPIADLGIQNCVWSVTGSSNSWISASVSSGGTVLPEAETGLLSVGVNTAGMTTGVYWGTVNLTTTNGNAFYVGVRVELTPPGAPAPEMDVEGSGNSIADGSAVPLAANGTDFGSANVGGNTSHSFTIANFGNAALNLTGSPQVTISGTNASDFTVTAQPTSPVPSLSSTSFTIRFSPTGGGARTASVSIANDDSDENPYDFAIQGTGVVVAPEIDVQGNGVSIPDGDTAPSSADGTDFGTLYINGATVDQSFTIVNSGNAALNLTGSPKVSISGANAGDFAVTVQPASPVSASGSTTFTIRFDPSAAGLRTATVSIASDDGNENPYDFSICGTGSSAPSPPVAGMTFWLKADAGVVKDASNMVSEWADQSSQSSSKKVSQSNPAYQPQLVEWVVNGLPIVRFSGSTCAMPSADAILTGTTAFTVFSVFRANSLPGTNYQYVWWDGTDSPTAGYGLWVPANNRLRTGWGNSTSSLSLTYPVQAGVWYRTCSRYTSGAHDAWLNGVSTGSNAPTGASLASGFTVGNCGSPSAYQGLCGEVAEILVYSRKLTDEEVQAVDAYLASRWVQSPPVLIDRIGDLRSISDGVMVSLTTPKVVTVDSSTFKDGSCYLEDTDRSWGVKAARGTLALWDNVTVTGTLGTNADGERVLYIASIDSSAAGEQLGALGTSNYALKTSGLLVRVWGRVVDTAQGYFTLDDGSGIPVRVDVSGLAADFTMSFDTTNYVAVTGLSGLQGGVKVVRPRGNSDLTVLQ